MSGTTLLKKTTEFESESKTTLTQQKIPEFLSRVNPWLAGMGLPQIDGEGIQLAALQSGVSDRVNLIEMRVENSRQGAQYSGARIDPYLAR